MEVKISNVFKDTLEKLSKLEKIYNSQVRKNSIYQDICNWLLHNGFDITPQEEEVMRFCYGDRLYN
jgi:hypothetical protein